MLHTTTIQLTTAQSSQTISYGEATPLICQYRESHSEPSLILSLTVSIVLTCWYSNQSLSLDGSTDVHFLIFCWLSCWLRDLTSWWRIVWLFDELQELRLGQTRGLHYFDSCFWFDNNLEPAVGLHLFWLVAHLTHVSMAWSPWWFGIVYLCCVDWLFCLIG